MNTRRAAAAAFFVAICLVLCGLVVRRQIAAHPLLHGSGRQEAEAMGDGRPGGDGRGFPMEQQGWRMAPATITREAKETVQGQLQALHAGDGRKAMSFQSRGMQSMFGDPNRFAQMIAIQYPEFGHYRSAQFGPIWSDASGSRARALVTVLGENGHRARGEYLLVREAGQLRIIGVRTQRLPN